MKREHGESANPILSVNGYQMILPQTDEGLSMELQITGTHEPLITQCMKDELKAGMVVIDIGANIGYYALLEALIVGDHGLVYAIEPVARNFVYLNENIELNQFRNIRVMPFAIGDRTAKNVPINITKKFNWCHMIDLEKAPPHLQEQFRNDTIRQDFVSQYTLDTFAEYYDVLNIDFIRMDVEGYEVEIVKGMHHTMEHMKPGSKMLIEFHRLAFCIPGPILETIQRIIDHGFKPVRSFFIGDIHEIYGDDNWIEKYDLMEAPVWHCLFIKEES